jgi:hypothetical protein
MLILKNTATNAAELYKLLGNSKIVYHKRLGPVHVNKLEMLTNPASDVVTVYTQDGSDYDTSIVELKGIVDFNNN